MFGSEIIDVVIGMIFVFLTLSLVCTAVNEIIEAWLNKRASCLEKGIIQLLSKPGETNSRMVKKIYNHPLIAGLFRGEYVSKESENKSDKESDNKSDKEKTLLPSYIPAENFAAAIIDVFLNSSGNAGANTASPPTVITSPPTASFSLDALRNAVDANINDPLLGPTAKALRALMETAGNDAEKVKKNIETWFNNSMDRVSGWYKRQTQVIILLLGLGVAIGVNADAITITNSLSHDKALRDSLITSAQKYAEADASNSKPGASPSPSPGTTSSPVTQATEVFKKECQTNNNTKGACSENCLKNVNSAECKLEVQMANIRSLGLPIGWDWNDPNLVPRTFGGMLLKLFGWLITAFAISLGAPFWFDLLNMFMVVRSTVKPKEKSPNEPSKP